MNVRFPLLLCLVLMALPSTPLAGQKTAEELLQSAQYKQQVEGDLEGAIAILQTLVDDFADHREIAASALLLLGRLHETMGSANAEEAYRRVLREYPDQRGAAEEARARLAALTQAPTPTPPNQMVVRRVLSDEDTDVNHFFDMRVSPDGTQVVYTDQGYTGDVYIRDLASGDTTKVADGWAYTPIWSSDGTKIAFGVVPPGDPDGSTLTILDLATGEESVPAALANLSLSPYAWSPGGDLMACWIGGGARGEASLGLVSLTTGQITRLGDCHARTSADFSPDGRYVAFSDVVDGNTDIYLMDVVTGTRHRITAGPDVEAVPLWAPRGDDLVYTGVNGTWALPMSGSVPTGAARLLSTEGYQQPAGWTEDGSFFRVRYNVLRQSLQVPVDPEAMVATGPPEPLPLTPFRKGSRGFRWSPDMRKIAIGKWGTVDVYSFEDQQLRTYQVGPGFSLGTLEWTTDGSRTLFADLGGRPDAEGMTVVGLDLSTGDTRELFPRISGVSGWLRLLPKLGKMAFYRGDPNAREMQLVVADFGSVDGVVLADETKMEDGRLSRWVRPQLSPDGSKVLFGTIQHEIGGRDFRYQLWVTAADGSGAPRRLAAAYWIPCATWHPESTYIAFNTWEEDEMGPGNLYVVDVETGDQHEIALPPGLEGMEVHDWSPNGRWIGIVNSAGSYELLIIENALGDRMGGR
jgi:Tol biopolymer transport system component